MDMKAEPTIRECALCRRGYAVRYESATPRVPCPGTDRVHVRAVRCPSCGHRNPVVLPMGVHHVEVERFPARERRTRFARHLVMAAMQLMRQFRPFLS